MSTRVTAIIVVLVFCAAAAHSASAEQQVLRAQEEARQALLNGDVAMLDKLWVDDFVSTTASGQLRTKSQFLDALRSGQTNYVSLEYDELNVRVYGKTAVMTGRARGEGVRNGVRLPASAHGTRFTEVFVKRHGEWKLVAHQATTVTE